MNSKNVAMLTGATPRMLQTLDEDGTVSPLRDKKNDRDYKAGDALRVMLIYKLTGKGLSLHRSKVIVSSLQDPILNKLFGTKEDLYLITDGSSVAIVPEQELVRKIIDFSGPLYVIRTSDLVTKIKTYKPKKLA